MTPNTSELCSAQIPALATLVALGWEYLAPADCLAQRGGTNGVLLSSVLIGRLGAYRFRHQGKDCALSNNAIAQILRELSSPGLQDGLLSANEKLYHALTLGITVTEFIAGKKLSLTVPLIDWQYPLRNQFQITEEFILQCSDGTRTRRPDMVGFVNGLPLVVIEAKRPAGSTLNQATVAEGISQMIRNQKPDEIPQLFVYAQLLLAISGVAGRYGTTKTQAKFWCPWKEEEFSEAHFTEVKNRSLGLEPRAALMANRLAEVTQHFNALWQGDQAVNEQDRLLIGLLGPARLLEFLRYFILFDRKADKIAARYQQVFGVKSLIARLASIGTDGARQGGVIWHTTGSGKSFTMVYLCKALLLEQGLQNCRVIVVTDRLDLEKQLAGNFLTGGALGFDVGNKKAGAASKVSSGRDLAKRIASGTDRIIFTLIHKFGSATKLPECHNSSADLIVLIDEGHRSQGGENHERMRAALPNAAFIAFTGTPLLQDDKTAEKFGKIIHAYTMRDATEDGTVTPLLYEERQPELEINKAAIDNWFDKITLGLSARQKSDLKKKYGKKGPVYGSTNRIDLIAWDIALHFKTHFLDLDLALKGQIATDSKLSAVRYKKALDATGLVSSAIIISPPDTREGHSDVDEAELPEVQDWWKANVKGDPLQYERQTIEHFATPGKPDLLIVVDKLLTGFDEPRNAVLYIDKPLEQHSLIQAIARVNRLHEQKRFGLLIDYRGILPALDTAMANYKELAERTRGGFDLDDIAGMYANVSTEYKRLPTLQAQLWALFKSVRNKSDREQYRQLLVPRISGDLDSNQKAREDFYGALTAFGICLKTALSSRSFFEDGAVTEADITLYKKDLNFFSELRMIARQDSAETVDFTTYENQIRKLLDRYVLGENIRASAGLLPVDALGQAANPADWSDEKTRNETDIIKSRIVRTIDQDLAEDPYAQLHFSELLRQAIAAAAAQFDTPLAEYTRFKDLSDLTHARLVPDAPAELQGRPHASAYFGILRIAAGEARCLGSERSTFLRMAEEIEKAVQKAVAENSLNPQNIEAAIRNQLLPSLFTLLGLDVSRQALEQLIQVVRVGLTRAQERGQA